MGERRNPEPSIALARKLRRSERKLAQARSLAELGVWEWDLATQRLTWSDEVFHIVGIAPGSIEPTYEAYERMLYPDDRALLTEAVTRAVEQQAGYDLEHRVVRPDGEVRSVRCVAEVEVEEGAVLGLYGILQDVTRDLEAEHRKRELLRARSAKVEAVVAEKRVREVLEAVPQQVWVTESEGRVLMVNGRVRSYFGAPAVGGAASLDGPDGAALRALIHPEDYERGIGAWRHARRTATSFSAELRLWSEPKQEFRWHLCRAEPQLDPDGRLVRWIGTNTDLHAIREAQAERARAERDARQERRRLRTIFERAPAAICITRGPDHQLMAANAAFRALAAGREAVGRPLAWAYPGLASQGITDLFTRVYASGRPHVDREIPIGEGVTVAYFNLVLQPLADARGETEGVLLHAVDVTDMVYARLAVEDKARELEELTRHLEAANEELDRFAYVTSHDLRAPLRGISNLAHWIEEDLSGAASDETTEHLALLRGRVTRLEMLIDGVLQYARAGRFTCEMERVDVRRLIDELVDLLDPPSDTIIDIEGAMPVLVTERVPLAQVLQNLLDNALTHGRGEEGRRVCVGVEHAEDAWAFWVRDDGPGIDPRYHCRIWEMFQTLNTDGRSDGTGIGLSLVRKIVEGRGGAVSVESTPGGGATFRFTWPEHPSRARGVGPSTMRIPGSRSGRATPVSGVTPRRGPGT